MTTIDSARPTEDEWAVPDDETAAVEQAAADLAWAVEQSRRLARARERMARVRASIEPQLDRLHAEEARLEEWATTQEAPIARYVAYLEDALGRYALAQRARGGRKSLDLPYARVQTREAGGKWVASAEALEWARTACPDAAKKEEALLVSALQRLPGARVEGDRVVTADGEVIPGIVVEPKRVEATVRVVEDAP